MSGASKRYLERNRTRESSASNTNHGETIHARSRPRKTSKLTPGDEYTDDDLWATPVRSAWRSMAKHGAALAIYTELVHQQFYENERDGNAAYDGGINQLAHTLDITWATCNKGVQWLADPEHRWIEVSQNGQGATVINVLKSPWHKVFGDVPLPVSKPKRKVAAPSLDPSTGKPIKAESRICAGMTKIHVPCLQFVTKGEFCRHHLDQDPSHISGEPTSHLSGEGVPTFMVKDPPSPFPQPYERGLDTHSGTKDTSSGTSSLGFSLKDSENATGEKSERDAKLARIRGLAQARNIDLMNQ